MSAGKGKASGVRKSGKFRGKSNALGHGGRAAQLRAKGVPEGVIGELARKAHAAPGQENYHGKHSARHAMRSKAKGKIHGGARGRAPQNSQFSKGK